ncbi:hypothetical protein L218DRAFT_917817 [Marasmius fiardii PR-910]|nr:hypothetical protein L218DRAFT_917817 [Marasmius fiardii PR-910]
MHCLVSSWVHPPPLFTMNTVNTRVARPPSPNQPLEFRKKDGTPSKMRSHNGNIPMLPQTKLCPHCPAKFTRTTHLNRHLRNHTNERLHNCNICGAQFTRSDLLSRHKKGCNEQTDRTRRKSCVACTESKIKCDRQTPCTKCASKGKRCVYALSSRRNSSRRYMDDVKPTSLFPTAPTIFGTDPTSRSERTASHSPGSEVGRSSLASSSPHSFDTGIEIDTQAEGTTNTHLASLYSGEMFEPLFSNVFATLDASYPGDPSPVDGGGALGGSSSMFPFGVFFGDCVPFQETQSLVNFNDGISNVSALSVQPAVSHVRHNPQSSDPEDSMDPGRRHYLQLFFTVFLEQMPIVHPHTFSVEGRPPLLLIAMQACGALYVRTRQAAAFILNTLTAAREILVEELPKLDHASASDQVNLIIAVVLLQTVGLFHQKADQRASSGLFHGMLVMMIRRSQYLTKVVGWDADAFAALPLDLQWREWANHETTKRALLLSYLHDCCQILYFSSPPSYLHNEMDIELPCENALWSAKSASEWWAILERKSPFGDYRSRLAGPRMLPTIAAITEARIWDINPPPLSAFAHWVVVHSILRRMFTMFTENPAPFEPQSVTSSRNDAVEQVISVAQFSLHNWLKSWLNCPEMPKATGEDEEPPFMQHPLPFYWLGQIALMAYREGLPPFHPQTTQALELRFPLVKQWLFHIRRFLKQGGDASTLAWDELMRIRLQSWQADAADERDEGLLGFFEP